MNIHPTHNGRTPEPGPKQTAETPPAPPPRADRSAETEPVAPPLDRVELSPDARALNEQTAATQPDVGQLPPEHMKQVLTRLSEGFYDRPEIRMEVLRRLAGDLGIRLGGD